MASLLRPESPLSSRLCRSAFPSALHCLDARTGLSREALQDCGTYLPNAKAKPLWVVLPTFLPRRSQLASTPARRRLVGRRCQVEARESQQT